MQLKYRLPLAILAAAAFVFCRVHAQDDDDDEEEFGSFGIYSHAPQAITLNLKMTQGARVNFGNLGNVVMPVTRGSYMDGTVTVDARRLPSTGTAAEVDGNGKPLYPSGGTYSVTYQDSTNNTVTATYIAYNPTLTRSWQYLNASQADEIPGYIAFHTYSAYAQGSSAVGSRGYTGGIELALAHNLNDPQKRISYSLTAGVTLGGINSSNIGTVNSTLHVTTDYYSLNGAAAPVPALNPASGNYYQGPSGLSPGADGNTTESTVTLSATPDPNLTDKVQDIPNGAQVHGVWKIKGGYFVFKFGPQISAKVTRSLGLNAGLGFAGTYVGTSYTAEESFNVDGIPTTIPTPNLIETNNTNKFLPGYYANLDATWTINDRAGLFAGVSYDNLGDYNQSVGSGTGGGVRTSKIDLSATAGVRGGLTIKF